MSLKESTDKFGPPLLRDGRRSSSPTGRKMEELDAETLWKYYEEAKKRNG